MALLSVIRRWHFRQHIPIREIERRTGLSRNTIRKYLRSDAVEPVFKVPARPSKLDPFAEKLSGWLKVESGKSRKQRRTAKQMRDEDFSRNYVLNVTIVDCLLADPSGYETQTRRLLDFIASDFDACEKFFSSYYARGKAVTALISRLATTWPGFVAATQSSSVPRDPQTGDKEG